jgi:exopolyphosphatase/guanosine-5'-triphosphate,3'-diphosphate pyrophosphatase
MDRIAVLDVGTNSVKCLVAEPDGAGDLRPLSDRVSVVRLGEGLDRTERLDGAAMERTLSVMVAFAGEARAGGARRIIAVGTEALRKAENASEFIAAAEKLGIPLRVIPGEEEADLSFRAASSRVDTTGGALVFDAGGGSVEIVAGDGGGVRSRMSVPVGALRLHERHLAAADPPGLTAAKTAILGAVSALEESGAAALLTSLPGRPLVGIGGTVTAMASVELCLVPYDATRVQGYILTRGAVRRQIDRYASMSVQVRRRIRGLPPERALLILAGACLVAALLECSRREALQASDRGLRYGVALEVFAEGAEG